MDNCTITTATGKADLQVCIIGGACQPSDGALGKQATRLADGTIEGPQLLNVDGTAHLLLKVDEQDYLAGGENYRLLGKQIVDALRGQAGKAATVCGCLDNAAWQALAEGAVLADYRYLTCRSGKAAKRSKITLRLPSEAKAAAARGARIAAAQNAVRELADGPGNLVNPKTVVATAKKLFKGTDIKVEVIEGLDALGKAGFPGLVQVGKGAAVQPALLTLRYRPKKKPAKGSPTLAYVGKGITFDAGGISLKPGAGMWMMKGDMGGAVAVLGAMLAIAEERPGVAINAYCALAENLPDAKAQRPGDIYQARNGTYIHVDNTDAEGRLVLSDVLTYACEEGATHMVDLATLTGACIIALGHGVAALMSRHDGWAAQVAEAGAAVGERLWRLPLPGDYKKQLEHPHADLNNIGGRPAGTITAGLFLGEFVQPTVEWAHLDIAGTAMQEGEWRYYQKGMTGFGVRSLVELACRLG